MVKRKTSFDRAEKAAKPQKTTRKPSKAVRFEDMVPIVDEGVLTVKRGSEVFFERKKEGRPILCVGSVINVYDTEDRNDGTIEIWDETHEECWAFNWKKDMDKVSVRRVPTKPEKKLDDITDTVPFAEELLEDGEHLAKPPAVAVKSAPLDDCIDDEGNKIIIDADPPDEMNHVAR